MGSEQSSNKNSKQDKTQYNSTATSSNNTYGYSRPNGSSPIRERIRNPYSYVQQELQRNFEYPNQTIDNSDRVRTTQNSVEYVFVSSEDAMRWGNTPSRPVAPSHEFYRSTPPVSQPATQYTCTPSAPTLQASQSRPATPARPASPAQPSSQARARSHFRRPASGNRRTEKNMYNCPTCNNRFGLEIFTCPNKHSSCKECRLRGAGCGICGLVITDTKNYAMQDFMTQVKGPCPNAADGCSLHLNIVDMDIHTSECPFAKRDCPMNSIFGNCGWRGKTSQMLAHFDSMHPEQRQGDIGTELVLHNIYDDRHNIYFVPLKPFNFVFHIKMDSLKRVVFMTAQLIGTGMSAAKWNYEVHIYNKREPRRKYVFVSPCTSDSLPVTDVFRSYDCVALPLTYAHNFINNGILTYKFFIKKVIVNSKFVDGDNNGDLNETIDSVIVHNSNFRGNRQGRGKGKGRGRGYHQRNNN